MKATVPANDRELVKLLRLSLAVTKPRDSAANGDCPKTRQSHQEKTKTRKTSVKAKSE